MTERRHTGEVKAVRFESWEQIQRNEASGVDVRGAYELSPDAKHIICICPCGCDQTMRLSIFTGPDGPHVKHPAWSWDGNVEAPSLAPSIRDVGRCFFHGHLKGGVWTFERDSGVKA